ncbi:hypothetical protein [Nonomuraea sediminis]|uniref:hypothetical protein n=1 Tax=Nonomuraea sediminis TaxID=2835864 RepID=UPI001BDC4DF8|nr:hypothetical protein [Nonomuraea sediminis]
MTRTLRRLGDRMLGTLLPSATAEARGCPPDCWCYHWLDHTAYYCTRSNCTTYIVCYECCD